MGTKRSVEALVAIAKRDAVMECANAVDTRQIARHWRIDGIVDGTDVGSVVFAQNTRESDNALTRLDAIVNYARSPHTV